MIQFRYGVFETNSSSTHSMIICTKAQYDKLAAGELYIDAYGTKLYTREEALRILAKEMHVGVDHFDGMDSYDIDDNLEGYAEIVRFDKWKDELEHARRFFTSPSGDEMVVHCAYGHD